jgi:hypothetical protein
MGTWVLQGTVRNWPPKARSVQIVVGFVTQPGSTVLSSRVVDIAGFGPRASAHWSVTGARAHPMSPASCDRPRRVTGSFADHEMFLAAARICGTSHFATHREPTGP